MAGGAHEAWSVLYWPAGLVAGSLYFWATGSGDPVSIVGEWAVYWPWLVAGWWVVVRGAAVLFRRRPRLTARGAASAVVVLLAGTVLTAAAHLAPRADWLGVGFGEQMDLYDLLGENFEFRELYQWTVPDGAIVEINNTYGPVRVTPSGDDNVRLEVRKSVRANGIDEARRLAPELVFRMEETVQRVLIRSNHDAMTNAERFRTSLDVRIPPTSRVVITNDRGAVEVRGFPGLQTIYARDGDVLASPEGGSLEAHALRGDVRIVFEGPPRGPVRLSVTDGDLRVELPPDSGAVIHGDVRSGSFASDFGTIVSTREAEGLKIEGQVGDPVSEVDFRVAGGDMKLIDRGRWFRSW